VRGYFGEGNLLIFYVEIILFLEYRYQQVPKKRIDLGRQTVYFSMSVAVGLAGRILETPGELRCKFWLAGILAGFLFQAWAR